MRALSTTLILLSTVCSVRAQTVTDVDGNTYPLVTIGEQVWTAQNMRVTHYPDGTLTSYYCFPDGDATLVDTLGYLYTWNSATHTAVAEGAQGICPDGFHVPTDAEWMVLFDELGGTTMAAGHLKSASGLWQAPNPTDASSGFEALPAGNCYNCMGEGACDFLGAYAEFWTSTPIDVAQARNWTMYHLSTEVLRHYNQDKPNAFSVRCLSDFPASILELGTPLFQLLPLAGEGGCLLETTSVLAADAQLNVVDALGRTVLAVRLNGARQLTIPLSTSGVYLITVTSGYQRWTQRCVVP